MKSHETNLDDMTDVRHSSSLESDEQKIVLTDEEIDYFSRSADKAISGQCEVAGINAKNDREVLEGTMLASVHGLPEKLAHTLGTVDPAPFLERAEALRGQIGRETEPKKIAELQTDIIYQYIAIISKVQNGGGEGFTPALAREVNGMDCSLSAWSLKEKLQGIPHLQFKFGYPPGHAIGVVTLADGRKLYVDAQNGFAREVSFLKPIGTKETGAAYEIVEVQQGEKVLGELPNGEKVSITRADGCEYVPNYMGMSESGVLLTTGNMFMFAFPTSQAYFSNTGRTFRKNIGIPEMPTALYEKASFALQKWKKEGADPAKFEQMGKESLGDDYQKVVDYDASCKEKFQKFEAYVDQHIAGGKTLYHEDFKHLMDAFERHHATWQDRQKQRERDMGEAVEIAAIRQSLKKLSL